MQNEVSKPADNFFSSRGMNKNPVVTHRVGSVAEQGPAGFFGRTDLALAAGKGKWWEFLFHATLVIRVGLNEMGGVGKVRLQDRCWERGTRRAAAWLGTHGRPRLMCCSAGPIPPHFFKEILHLYC